MKYILPPLAGILVTLLGLLCPILVLFSLPFIKWDADGLHGDLPKWLFWFSTPDCRLPGGLYEPSVRDWLIKRGKYATSWYWLAIRNQLNGLAYWLGKPTTQETPDVYGYWTDGNTWRYQKNLGKLRFAMGWKALHNGKGGFQAVPLFTLKVQ